MVDYLVMTDWAIGDRSELRLSWGESYDYWCTASFLGWDQHPTMPYTIAVFFIGGEKRRDRDAFYDCPVQAEFQGEVFRGICIVEWTEDWGGGWCVLVSGSVYQLSEPLLDRVLA